MVIALQRALDRFIGALVSLLFAPFVRHEPVPQPRRICVVKLWAIGESILTLPMIAALHKKFPSATIDVIVRDRNKQVYVNQPFIDRVVMLKDALKLFNHYDLCIDCEPYLNISAIISFYVAHQSLGFRHGVRHLLYSRTVPYNDNQHVVLTYLDLISSYGKQNPPTVLVSLRYSLLDKQHVDRYLKDVKIGRKTYLVGIEAGAAESAECRMWPKEKFAALCDKLIDDGCTPIFVGAGHELQLNSTIIGMIRHHEKAINTAGKFNLGEFFALADRLDMMISNDTGSMHIAAAQGTKTIGLFCPNTPVRFAPYGRNNAFVYKPVRDHPCINVHKAEIGNNCSGHDHMSRISVDDVYKAYRKLRRRR